MQISKVQTEHGGGRRTKLMQASPAPAVALRCYDGDAGFLHIGNPGKATWRSSWESQREAGGSGNE